MSPARGKGPLPDPVRGRIAVVGPCASGKTALVERLCARGYEARQCAQEHSYVADMWQRLSRPQVLVYLDVSLEIASVRRGVTYVRGFWQEQGQRLAHARQHSDIYVQTDCLSEEEAFATTIEALAALGIEPANGATERDQRTVRTVLKTLEPSILSPGGVLGDPRGVVLDGVAPPVKCTIPLASCGEKETTARNHNRPPRPE